MRENFTDTMSKIDYNNLTVPELRSMCKKRDMKGLSKLKKLELVTLLLQSDNKHCSGGGDDGDDGDEFQPIIKKTRFKILNKLIESKKLIVLTKTKDSRGMQILYNSDTNFVFVNIEDRKNKPEHHIVVGVLVLPELTIQPLTKQHILMCRELNFDYNLPENISEKDDEKFESDELLSAIKMRAHDDDEDDTIPNYDELLI